MHVNHKQKNSHQSLQTIKSLNSSISALQEEIDTCIYKYIKTFFFFVPRSTRR